MTLATSDKTGGDGDDILDGGDGDDIEIQSLGADTVTSTSAGKDWLRTHARTSNGKTVLDLGGKERTLPRADPGPAHSGRILVLISPSCQRRNRTCGSGAGR